jgi:branched-chain amino acid transport system permease protein
MSTHGRPKGSYRSAEHEGTPMSAPRFEVSPPGPVATRAAGTIRARWIVIAVAVAVIAVAPAVLGKFGVSLLNDIGIGALVALGLVMLTGVGGATSFGQAAFVGIAAYATAWLTTAQGVSPWIGLAFALLLTGGAALIIGALTLRLGGHFLPLSTIAWGLSIALLFGNVEALGRHTGLSNIPALNLLGFSLADPRAVYYLIWVLVGLGVLFCHNVLESRPGRAIRSLRGGSILLASVGADAFRVRLTLFVLAALLAGVAGWLYAHANRFVSPSPFDVRASIEYLLMAVAGGLGQLTGALVGAAAVLVMKNGVQDVLPIFTARGGQFEAVVFALLFILLLHHARGGVMGLVTRWTRSRFAPVADATPAANAEPLPRRTPPAGGELLLSVRNAVKRFGGLVAVNDVSFDVRAGEIVGLIGPNGAGKSTMFNLLTGTAPMTGGRVEFLGHDITGLAQRVVANRGMARTFQHVKLRPHMTLLDNVALGAHGRTRSGVLAAGLRLDRREEARILAEARRQLERIGLADRAHELAGSLPLGTQRVLEIARALAADPVLLVLDEPAAGLRSKEKQQLGGLLRKLRSEGVTILIVEHDMDFVMKLVDRLVVMNFGSKLIEGEPAVVRADPGVQAAYLGSAAPAAAEPQPTPKVANGGR